MRRDDPGRIQSEDQIVGGWPLPSRPKRDKPFIGPSDDPHVGDIGVAVFIAFLIVLIVLAVWRA